MSRLKVGHVLLWSVLVLSLCRPEVVSGVESESELSGQSAEVDFQLAPVRIDGNVLFQVRGLPSYPAKTRARAIVKRIKAVAADPSVSPDSLHIEESDSFSAIKAGKRVLVRVVYEDAELEGIERSTLAEAFQNRIGNSIRAWRSDRAPGTLKRNRLIALGATFLLVFGLVFGHWVYRRLRLRIQEKVRDVLIQQFRLLRRDQLWQLLMAVLRLLWVAFLLLSVYFYLYGVLSLFPWTRQFANDLFFILVGPVKTLSHGLLKRIPDIVFLCVLFFTLRYLLKLIHLFFTKIADGSVALSGFEAEWAWPTYRLVRLLLIILFLIIAYPYIPGSDSAAFKGLSIFVGVLFSLGSTSLIGNLIAGYTMTYRRAFKKGDRIKVGEHIGDVVQGRLLVTHLRSLKNEEVVIPNSVILNSEIVNFSTLAQQHGLILHTTVGIGYETPWRQVEAMLLEAAVRTPGLLSEPKPFVLQKTLDDFCINYEINCYCDDPKEMFQIYSDLHRSILDIFNEYEVQIMTPAYVRDPEQPKVVPKEKWHAAPAKTSP